MKHNRREFLEDVGKGMLLAGVGSALASELGISTAMAVEKSAPLAFGKLEPLVDLMQQTRADKLQPLLVEKLKSGTELKTLVAAGALANTRAFAGQDYIGFHTMMALVPSLQIANELPTERQALPVLKVLYRNTARIQSSGAQDRMHKVNPSRLQANVAGRDQLAKPFQAGDMQATEQVFAALVSRNAEDAYNDLQHIVHDAPDVHRVTLCWRAWDTLRLTGREHAEFLLRQSVRNCVTREQDRQKRNNPEPELRSLLPKLLDKYKLLAIKEGKRRADAAWIDKMSKAIFVAERAAAADLVAGAIADGINADDINEAISLAANLLVLHDPGRQQYTSEVKPRNSVHGDSPGVHAQDAANAWRNIGRVSNARNKICSLIVSAWHAAGQKKRVNEAMFAYEDDARQLSKVPADGLIDQLHAAIKSRDQAKACAVVQRWSHYKQPTTPVFDTLRQYAVSEDGALHAEKYFRTVTEEFAATRAEFRWRHLVGLARVTASEYGWPAPGRDEARQLLNIKT